jgi:hypothetical protein
MSHEPVNLGIVTNKISQKAAFLSEAAFFIRYRKPGFPSGSERGWNILVIFTSIVLPKTAYNPKNILLPIILGALGTPVKCTLLLLPQISRGKF